MKIVITGGSGFIGSNLVRYILRTQPDWQVTNLDALTYAGNPANLADVADSQNYQFVKGDIADPAVVAGIFEAGVDLVINSAAETHVDRSISDAAAFLHTNIIGTQVLLDATRQYGVGRFLQVSTDEVYGALGDTGQFTEELPLSPRSPYSASKAAADHLVMAAHHTHGMDVVITRCSNNYGPYQFPEKFIPLATVNAIEQREIPIYGDGLYVRDWLHVDDHCRGIVLAATQGAPGRVYNMGGASERTNLDVVREILRLTGAAESLLRTVTDRKGHDRRYSNNFDRMSGELGWNPTRNFEDGLSETVKWYQDNRGWWQNILSGEYQNYYQRMYGGSADSGA